MATRSGPAAGDLSIAEIKEFAGFPAATQRYIRRSLDIGLERDDAISRWSRDMVAVSYTHLTLPTKLEV